MGKTVIIGDVKTLEHLLGMGVLSAVDILAIDFKVLDWLQLNSEQKSACMRYGVKYVSLTECEVKEAIEMYQQDDNHRVGIAQYGALVFAKNNDVLFASCDQLTLNSGKKIVSMQSWLADDQRAILPMFEVHGIDNQITIAI